MSIVRALTIPPAQTLNSVATGAADRQIVAAGAGAVPSVVYGEAIVTGRVLNVLASGSSNLVVQVVWALGPIQSIDLPLYKDRALPAGAAATHYTGTSTQTVDSTMVAAMAAQSITYTSALQGIAYSVFVVPITGFDGSLKFTARVRGRLLYDPRKDSTVSGGSGAHRLATPSTWEYSDNPSLADADWLRSDVYGCGVAVDWVSVIAAANANDALIGSPSEKRRVIGLEIDTARPVADVAEALRAYAGVWHVHTQASATAGAVKLTADADAAAVASYSHASGQILRFGPLQARDISSAPTAVEVVYTDASKRPTRDAYARASVPGAGSTLPLRLSQVRLPGITRYSQALREATERLNKLRLGDLTAGIDFLDEGLRHEVGDIINITHPVGVTAKPFRISEPPQLVATGRWRASLVEHDPAVYSTTVQTAPSIPDTALVIGGGRPADWVSLENRPANLSALAGTEPIQNTQIAVNGSGQLTGIGTGNNTAVANTNVSITAAGALLGAGGGQVSLSSLPGAIAATQVADGAITTAKFAAGIEPVAIVSGSTVPTTKTTNTIYLSGTGKLYRWDGSAYVTSVPAADVTGQIVAAQVADGAINTAKFASGIEPVRIVSSVPGSSNGAAVLYNTADGKVYRWNGTAYVATVPAGDLSGLIGGGNLLFNSGFRSHAGGMPTGWSLYNNAGISATYQVSSGGLRGQNFVRVTANAATTQVLGWTTSVALGAGVNWQGGQTHYITFWARASSAQAAGIYLSAEYANHTWVAFAYQELPPLQNGVWVRYVMRAVPTAGNSFLPLGQMFISWLVDGGGVNTLPAGAAFDITIPQVEIADAPSSWAPKPDELLPGSITATEIADDAITTPKLVAGAVVAGKIAANAVTAGTIAAGAVTANELAANSVTAGKIAAGAISATELAAGAVTTAKLAANAVTANEIAANAITAGKISTGAVTADKVAANAITAGKIAAGAVSATEIAAGAITTAKLAANAVTANEIAANAITAGKIAAGAVSATEIAAGAVTTAKLAAGAVTANEIAANAITTGKIAADAVTAVKIDSRGLILRDDAGNITFANGTAKPNICPNPDLIAGTSTTANGWNLLQAGNMLLTLRYTDPNFGPPWNPSQPMLYGYANDSTGLAYWISESRPVDTSKPLCVSGWVRRYVTTAGQYLGVVCYNAAGAEIGIQYVALANQPAATTWTRYYGTIGPGQAVAFPAGTARCAVIFIPIYESGVGGAFGTRFALNEGTSPSESVEIGGVSSWNPITSSNATTFIANAAIGAAQIESLNVGVMSTAVNGGASSGARITMETNVIKVFDSAGVKRVQIGNLSA